MENSQRSAEWFEQRNGRFTASEIYKLMGIKGLGETGKTYAFEKAIEELYGQIDENFESYDMQRGTEMEPLAFAKFKELKSLEFIEVENCSFFPIGLNTGASPDGLVGNNGILEIKCPKANAFFKMVSDNEYSKNYFYQVQHQMMCTGRNVAHLFFYLVHNGSEYYHEITIPKCTDTVKLIESRIKEAIVIKEEYILKIVKNSQWINNIEVF